MLTRVTNTGKQEHISEQDTTIVEERSRQGMDTFHDGKPEERNTVRFPPFPVDERENHHCKNGDSKGHVDEKEISCRSAYLTGAVTLCTTRIHGILLALYSRCTFNHHFFELHVQYV
jgi:hypothetical protein